MQLMKVIAKNYKPRRRNASITTSNDSGASVSVEAKAQNVLILFVITSVQNNHPVCLKIKLIYFT